MGPDRSMMFGVPHSVGIPAACICALSSSIQKDSYHLAGIENAVGVKTALIPRMRSIWRAPALSSRKARLACPMPCSPDTSPPSSRACAYSLSITRSTTSVHTASFSPSWQMYRCRLPSPACPNEQILSPFLAPDAYAVASQMPQCGPGAPPSSHSSRLGVSP